MKSFGTYIAKHLAVFIALILILIVLNAGIFFATFYKTVAWDYGETAPATMLEMASEEASSNGLSHPAAQALRRYHIWAMYLSPDGKCLWSLDMPAEVPRNHTIQDVALFSRGYLQDYPVFTRVLEDGLLVLGYPKGSYTKLTSNYYPTAAFRLLPLFAAGMLGLDMLCLFLAYLLSKRKILQNTLPIVTAIQALAEGTPVCPCVTGELSDIADMVGKASHILCLQKEARASWTAGVSHDIRTPLSMIMGYACRIAESADASPFIREQAERIEAQSVKIRELVQDFHLISRLECGAQPLQKEPIRLSKLLRSYAADLLNAGIPDNCSVEIWIPPENENIVLEGDPHLLSRAINNLVQNSIRHNPQGCRVQIGLIGTGQQTQILVNDDGVGIPPEKIAEILRNPHPGNFSQHGMGLRIVRQIVEAHGGTVTLHSEKGNGCKVILLFPAESP